MKLFYFSSRVVIMQDIIENNERNPNILFSPKFKCMWTLRNFSIKKKKLIKKWLYSYATWKILLSFRIGFEMRSEFLIAENPDCPQTDDIKSNRVVGGLKTGHLGPPRFTSWYLKTNDRSSIAKGSWTVRYSEVLYIFGLLDDFYGETLLFYLNLMYATRLTYRMCN